jgi:outer membrane protein TolC
MRWKECLVVLALLLAVISGCKQQCFLTECDYNHYRNDMNLPADVDTNPEVAAVPVGAGSPPPRTILDPDRPTRYMTLNEAIALALENGKIGSGTSGTVDDSLASFGGAAVASGLQPIRALALQPAIVQSNIESSLSKFDAHWVSSAVWTETNKSTGGNPFLVFSNGQSADVRTALVKPLPTGGLTGITFDNTYTLLSNPTPGFINPQYRPTLQFAFEQPLLQGFGVEINQLRASHPGSAGLGGSLLPGFSTGGRVEGILITRLRFDQQRTEFERQVTYMLVNVETAYWNLYDAYWNLYAIEAALRQAYEAWKINRDRFEAGRISRQDLAQTRQQYELFRGQRITSLDTVLEDERQLRSLVGLPVEDATRIVPIDSPTLAPYQPDWATALNDALTLRPELLELRQDLKFHQMDLINQKNLLMPDVRFVANYDLNGLGSHLDGGVDHGNAWSDLASNKFHDWNVGLTANIPLGFRDAHAAVRSSHLALAQSYISLRAAETQAQSFLTLQYRQLFEFYAQIQAQRAQRIAAAIQLETRLKEYLAGRIILDILLTAQTSWATALQGEYLAITQYNQALARFEFAKGTILQHDNIVISEGALPQCAQVRAVEHERQRADAIVVRERAKPVILSQCCYAKGEAGLPQLPASTAPSLANLYEGGPASPDVTAKPSQAPTAAQASALPMIYSPSAGAAAIAEPAAGSTAADAGHSYLPPAQSENRMGGATVPASYQTERYDVAGPGTGPGGGSPVPPSQPAPTELTHHSAQLDFDE